MVRRFNDHKPTLRMDILARLARATAILVTALFPLAIGAETPPDWLGEWEIERARCHTKDVDGSPFPNYLALTPDTLTLRDTSCDILKVTPGGLEGVFLFRLSCTDDPAQDALIYLEEGSDSMSFAFGLFPQRPLVRCPPLDPTE